jgi:DNA-binding XRE family transcriptional regulator
MSSQPLTKSQAIAEFGGNQAELARALGLTRQAISRFKDGPLPERYDLKLRFVILPALRSSKSTYVDIVTGGCESEISDLPAAGAV